jgi:hypothetical protein
LQSKFRILTQNVELWSIKDIVFVGWQHAMKFGLLVPWPVGLLLRQNLFTPTSCGTFVELYLPHKADSCHHVFYKIIEHKYHTNKQTVNGLGSKLSCHCPASVETRNLPVVPNCFSNHRNCCIIFPLL